MKEGVYIVTENGEIVGIVKFAGNDPFLILSGSFDLLEFNNSGQTKQLSTAIINDIKTNSNKYEFITITTYREKVEPVKIKEIPVPVNKITKYRDFLSKTNDRVGLIMTIMVEQKLSHSEASNFIDKHVLI